MEEFNLQNSEYEQPIIGNVDPLEDIMNMEIDPVDDIASANIMTNNIVSQINTIFPEVVTNQSQDLPTEFNSNIFNDIASIDLSSSTPIQPIKPVAYNPDSIEYRRARLHPAFNRLGFDPTIDNDSYYNANTNIGGDMMRAAKMFPKGFVAGVSNNYASFGDWVGFKFTDPTYEEARMFADVIAVGYSTRGGVLPFFSNNALQLSQTVGTLSAIAVENYLLGLATVSSGGTAAPASLPKFVSNIGKGFKVLAGIPKIFKTSSTILETLRVANNANKFYDFAKTTGKFAADLFTPQTLKAIKDLRSAASSGKSITDMAKAAKTFGAFYKDIRTLNMTLAESKMEGAFAFDDTFEKSYRALYLENDGKEFTQDQIDLLNNAATKAATKTIFLNAPAIFLSNAIVLSSVTRGSNSSMVRAVFGKTLPDVANKIIKNKKAIATVSGKATRQSNIYGTATGLFAELQKIRALGLKGNFTKGSIAALKYTAANFAEGIQEVYQEGIQAGVSQYYINSITSPEGIKNTFSKFVIEEALRSQMSHQGFEVFMSGFVSGGMISTVQSLIFEKAPLAFKMYTDPAFKEKYLKDIEEFKKKLNEVGNYIASNPLDLFAESTMNFNNIAQSNSNASQAVIDGDMMSFKDAQDDIAIQNASFLAANNMTEAAIEQLDDYMSLDDKTLEEAFEKEISEGAVKDANEIRNNLRKGKRKLIDNQIRYDESFDVIINPFKPEDYPEGSLERDKESVKYATMEYARKLYVFAQGYFERAVERRESIEKTLGSSNVMDKMELNDLVTLTSKSRMGETITNLKSEISVLKDLEQNDKVKLDIQNKTKELNAIIKLYNKLESSKNSEGLIDDSKEKTVKEIRELLKDYISTLASNRGGNTNFTNIDDILSMIFDFANLDYRSKIYNKVVNYFGDPKAYGKLLNSIEQGITSVYDKAKEFFEKSIQIVINDNIVQGFVNSLEEKGMYLDPMEVLIYRSTNNIDSITKVITPKGTFLINDMPDILKEFNLLKDTLKASRVTETTDETEVDDEVNDETEDETKDGIDPYKSASEILKGLQDIHKKLIHSLYKKYKDDPANTSITPYNEWLQSKDVNEIIELLKKLESDNNVQSDEDAINKIYKASNTIVLSDDNQYTGDDIINLYSQLVPVNTDDSKEDEETETPESTPESTPTPGTSSQEEVEPTSEETEENEENESEIDPLTDPSYESLFFTMPLTGAIFKIEYGSQTPSFKTSIELRYKGNKGYVYIYNNPNTFDKVKVDRTSIIIPIAKLANMYTSDHVKVLNLKPGKMYLDGNVWKLQERGEVAFATKEETVDNIIETYENGYLDVKRKDEEKEPETPKSNETNQEEELENEPEVKNQPNTEPEVEPTIEEPSTPELNEPEIIEEGALYKLVKEDILDENNEVQTRYIIYKGENIEFTYKQKKASINRFNKLEKEYQDGLFTINGEVVKKGMYILDDKGIMWEVTKIDGSGVKIKDLIDPKNNKVIPKDVVNYTIVDTSEESFVRPNSNAPKLKIADFIEVYANKESKALFSDIIKFLNEEDFNDATLEVKINPVKTPKEFEIKKERNSKIIDRGERYFVRLRFSDKTIAKLESLGLNVSDKNAFFITNDRYDLLDANGNIITLDTIDSISDEYITKYLIRTFNLTVDEFRKAFKLNAKLNSAIKESLGEAKNTNIVVGDIDGISFYGTQGNYDFGTNAKEMPASKYINPGLKIMVDGEEVSVNVIVSKFTDPITGSVQIVYNFDEDIDQNVKIEATKVLDNLTYGDNKSVKFNSVGSHVIVSTNDMGGVDLIQIKGEKLNNKLILEQFDKILELSKTNANAEQVSKVIADISEIMFFTSPIGGVPTFFNYNISTKTFSIIAKKPTNGSFKTIAEFKVNDISRFETAEELLSTFEGLSEQSGIKFNRTHLRKHFEKEASYSEIIAVGATQFTKTGRKDRKLYLSSKSSTTVKPAHNVLPVVNQESSTQIESPEVNQPKTEQEIIETLKNENINEIPENNKTDELRAKIEELKAERDLPETKGKRKNQIKKEIIKLEKDISDLEQGAFKISDSEYDYNEEDVTEFIKWLQDTLPSDILTVELIDNININLRRKRVPIGKFIMTVNELTGNIEGTIRTIRNNRVGYHEAFHMVFRMLLTDAQQIELRKSAKKALLNKLGKSKYQDKLKNFRSLNPKYAKLTDKELEELYLEEHMADEFSKFKVDKKSSKSESKIKSFFNKLLDFLRYIFSPNKSLKLLNLFKAIDKGKFKNSNISLNSFVRALGNVPTLEANKLIPTVIHSNGEAIAYLDPAASELLIKAISLNYVKKVQEGLSSEAAIDYVIDQYKQMYIEMGDGDNPPDTDLFWDIYSIFESEDADYITPIKESVFEYLLLFNVRDDYSEELLNSLEEEVGTRKVGDFDKSSDERGGFENLSREIKMFFMTTTSNKKEDMFGNKFLPDGSPIEVPVNYIDVYNVLLKASANTKDTFTMLRNMYKYSLVNDDARAVIVRFFDEVGISDIEGFVYRKENPITVKNSNFFNRFIKGMRNMRIDYDIMLRDPITKRAFLNSASAKRTIDAQISYWNDRHTEIYQKLVEEVNERNESNVDQTFDSITVFINELNNINSVSVENLDEHVANLANFIKNFMSDHIGVSLSPLYVEISIASLIDDDKLTVSLAELKKKSRGITLLDASFLNTLKTFYAKEYVNLNGTYKRVVNHIFKIQQIKQKGIVTKLKNIALANSLFDGTVGSSIHYDSDNNLIYSHQPMTYNFKRLDEINSEEGLDQIIEEDPIFRDNYLAKDPLFREHVKKGGLVLTRLDGFKNTNSARFLDQSEEKEKEPVVNSQDPGTTYSKAASSDLLLMMINHYLKYFNDTKINGNVDKKIVYTEKDGTLNAKAIAPVLLGIMESANRIDFVDVPIIRAVSNVKTTLKPENITIEGIKPFLALIKAEYNRIRRYHDSEGNPIVNPNGIFKFDDRSSGRAYKFFEAGMFLKSGNVNFEEQLLEAAKSQKSFAEAFKELTIDGKNLTDVIKEVLINEVNQTIKTLKETEVYDEITPYIIPNRSKISKIFGKSFSNSLSIFNLTDKPVHNIAQIVLSNWANTMHLSQLINGDPSKSLKEPVVDPVKRAKGNNAAYIDVSFDVLPDDGSLDFTLGDESIALFAFEDPESDMSSIDPSLGNSKVEDADAQVFGTAYATKYLFQGMGKRNPKMAELLDKIEKGEEITPDEFFGYYDVIDGVPQYIPGYLDSNAVINSQKFVYYDGPTFVKMSYALLSKQEVSRIDENGNRVARIGDQKRFNLLQKMEKFERDNPGKIAIAAPLSAIKKFKEKVNSLNKMFDESEINLDNAMLLDAQYFGEQLVNPSNKLKVVNPNQMKALITAEQNDDAEVILMGSNQSVTVGDIKRAYHKNVANGIRLNFETLKSLFYEAYALLGSDKDAAYRLMGDLSNSTDEDLKSTVRINLRNFLDYAIESEKASASPIQILEFFEVRNGVNVYSLNNPIIMRKFESLFYSYISNSVFKDKVSGNSLSLRSDYGVPIVRKVYTHENGVPDKQIVLIRSKFEKEGIEPVLDLRELTPQEAALQMDVLLENNPDGIIVIDRLRHNQKEYIKQGDPSEWVFTGQRHFEVVYPAHIKEVMQMIEYNDYPSEEQMLNEWNHWINESVEISSTGKVLRKDDPKFNPEKSKISFGKLRGYKTKRVGDEVVFVSKKLNVEGIPDVIANMYFVRIPSQDKHSGGFAKQVDFLPVFLGSTASFAKEIIFASGADFDIDKVFTHTLAIFLEGNEFKAYGITDKTGEEGLKEKFKHYVKYVNKQVNDKSSGFGKAYQMAIADGINDVENTPSRSAAAIEEMISLGFSYEAALAISKLNFPHNLNTFDIFLNSKGYQPYLAAIQNEQLINKIALTSNRGITEPIRANEVPIAFQPAGVDALKEEWEILSTKYPILLELFKESDMSIHSILGLYISHKNVKENSRLIGAVVPPNVIINFLKEFNVSLSEEYSFVINSVLYTGFKDIEEEVGRRTQFLISAIISAATDDAKERVLTKLGLNKKTIKIVEIFTAMGVPFDTAFSMIKFNEIQDALNEEGGLVSGLNQLIKALEVSPEEDLSKASIEKALGQSLDLGGVSLESTSVLKSVAIIVKKAAIISSYVGKMTPIFSLSKEHPRHEGIINLENVINGLGIYNRNNSDNFRIGYTNYINNKIKERYLGEAYPFDLNEINDLFDLRSSEYQEGKPWISEYLRIYTELRDNIYNKELITSQKIFKAIYRNVSDYLRVFNGEKLRVNLYTHIMSYLSIKAYMHRFEKILIENPDNEIAKQALFDLSNKRLYGASNESYIENINFLKSRVSDNYFLDNFITTIPIDDENNRFKANVILNRTLIGKISDYERIKVRNAYMELFYSSNPAIANAAKSLIHYFMVKDGFTSSEGSLIDIISPKLLNNYNAILNRIENSISNPEMYEEIFGLDINNLISDFVINYGMSASIVYQLRTIYDSIYDYDLKVKSDRLEIRLEENGVPKRLPLYVKKASDKGLKFYKMERVTHNLNNELGVYITNPSLVATSAVYVEFTPLRSEKQNPIGFLFDDDNTPIVLNYDFDPNAESDIYSSYETRDEGDIENNGDLPQKRKAGKKEINKNKVFVEKNVFTVTPSKKIDAKAKSKAKIANKYIGFAEGIEGSSTELYRQQILNQNNNVELYKGFWDRTEVSEQTDKVFLFGDNTDDRVNTKYVPSSTQAVIRGLPNAIGIDTKKDRGTSVSSYLTNDDFDWFKNHVDTQIQKAKNSGKTIVIPADGIGTGKAMLKEKAPKLFEYLQNELDKLKNGNSDIDFQEEQSSGYIERTRKNASADATIDFGLNQKGEPWTKKAVDNNNKKYIGVNTNNLTITSEMVNEIVENLNNVNAKTLNIAGMGIYNMKNNTQEEIDKFVYDLLKKVVESPNLKTKIESIRTGGQTGFDEAGAKAGLKLGIKTIVLAPKGWVFRNQEGKDISNKQAFENRFSQFNIVNSGNYSPNDVVFVSIPGKRGDATIRKKQQDKTIKEALKAISQGATLIADNKSYVESSDYNEGEKRLAKNLEYKGYTYSETTVDGNVLGVWTNNPNTIAQQKINSKIDNKNNKRVIESYSKSISQLDVKELRELANKEGLKFESDDALYKWVETYYSWLFDGDFEFINNIKISLTPEQQKNNYEISLGNFAGDEAAAKLDMRIGNKIANLILKDLNLASKLKIDHKIPMNFKDGTGGRKMRPEFKGKSTLELIKEGNRTATSRDRSKSYNQQNIKVGDIIEFYNKSGDTVKVRVTKEPYKLSEVTAEEWSKLEGWSAEMFIELKNKGYEQFQYELLNDLTEEAGIVKKTTKENKKSIEDELDELLEINSKKEEVKKQNYTYSFSYNGITIPTDFKLTEEQDNALKTLIDFVIGSPDVSITLSGYAGTGKTSIINYLNSYLKIASNGSIDSVYMAYTHSAVATLAENVVKSGVINLPKTVTSVVNPNDNSVRKGFQWEMKTNYENVVIVIDEISFVPDEYLKAIEKWAATEGVKVIMMGDIAQLAPMKKGSISNNDKKSPVELTASKAFSNKNLIQLTNVKRVGDTDILDVLTQVRNMSKPGPISYNKNSENLSVSDTVEFLNTTFKMIDNDPENTIIVTPLNAKVAEYNRNYRTYKFANQQGANTPLQVGEVIVGYLGTGSKKIDPKKDDFVMGPMNSISYVIQSIDKVTKKGITYLEIVAKSPLYTSLSERGMTVPDTTKFYHLPLRSDDITNYKLTPEQYAKNIDYIKGIYKSLYDKLKDVDSEIELFKKEQKNISSLLNKRDEILTSSVEMLNLNKITTSLGFVYDPFNDELIFGKNYNSKLSSYMRFNTWVKRDKDFDFGYAITIHKAQGKTIKNVAVDLDGINIFNTNVKLNGEVLHNEMVAMAYVALSRASEKLFVKESDQFDFVDDVPPIKCKE